PMRHLPRQNTHYPARSRYVLNVRDDLSCFSDRHFDFVYSEITLQHIPRPLATRYITELVRVTALRGLLVFGVVHPSWRWQPRALARRIAPDPLVRIARLLTHAGEPPPRLYGIGRSDVTQAIRAGNGRILKAG